MDMTCGWLNTKCRTRDTQVQNPGQRRLRVKSQVALRLLGVSTSSPCGVQAQLYRFSSAFTICSTNIPLLGQVLLWDPTLYWAVTSLQSPPTCDSSSVSHICADVAQFEMNLGHRIVMARKLSKTPVVPSQKQQERKRGAPDGQRQRMRGAQRMNGNKRTKVHSGYRPPLHE